MQVMIQSFYKLTLSHSLHSNVFMIPVTGKWVTLFRKVTLILVPPITSMLVPTYKLSFSHTGTKVFLHTTQAPVRDRVDVDNAPIIKLLLKKKLFMVTMITKETQQIMNSTQDSLIVQHIKVKAQ